MDGANEIQTSVIIDWFYRGFQAIGGIAILAGGYILRTVSSNIDAQDARLSKVEQLSKDNQLAIIKAENDMLNLQIKIMENVNKSIERVHDQIEHANKRADEKADDLIDKIDQLGRDLRIEIRANHTYQAP